MTASWWCSQTDPRGVGPALHPCAQPAGLDSVGTWTWACPGEGRSRALVDSLLRGDAPHTPARGLAQGAAGLAGQEL